MPIENVKMGKNVQYHDEKLLNLYGCIIGRGCRIGAFTEIGPCEIGKSCNIGEHCFIPEGVIIESYVFIGPRVTFVNDKFSPSKGHWRGEPKTMVGSGSSIGGGSVILPGVEIGTNAVVGAGSVVTKDVPAGATVYGNPAREHVVTTKYYDKAMNAWVKGE